MRIRPARSFFSNKRFRFGIAFLAVLFLGAGVLKFIRLAQTSVFLRDSWRTNILLRTSPAVVVSFVKDETEKTVVVSLPDNLSVRVPFGYGYYRMDAVWKLAALEHKDALSSQAVEDLLGVPISGWLSSASPKTISETEDQALIETVKSAFTITSLLNGNIQTNLNVLDRTILAWQLLNTRPSNTLLYATHRNPRLFIDATLADQTVIKVVNESALDQFLEQKFESTQIRQDGLLIKIFNTTSTGGIAQRFSRFITNAGGKVIAVGNAAEIVDQCLIVTNKDNAQKDLVRFVKGLFACESRIAEDTLEADVLLYVGISFKDRWAALDE